MDDRLLGGFHYQFYHLAAPSASFLANLTLLLLFLPGLPLPKGWGELGLTSIVFSESVLTMNDGMLTRVFPTL